MPSILATSLRPLRKNGVAGLDEERDWLYDFMSGFNQNEVLAYNSGWSVYDLTSTTSLTPVGEVAQVAISTVGEGGSVSEEVAVLPEFVSFTDSTSWYFYYSMQVEIPEIDLTYGHSSYEAGAETCSFFGAFDQEGNLDYVSGYYLETYDNGASSWFQLGDSFSFSSESFHFEAEQTWSAWDGGAFFEDRMRTTESTSGGINSQDLSIGWNDYSAYEYIHTEFSVGTEGSPDYYNTQTDQTTYDHNATTSVQWNGRFEYSVVGTHFEYQQTESAWDGGISWQSRTLFIESESAGISGSDWSADWGRYTGYERLDTEVVTLGPQGDLLETYLSTSVREFGGSYDSFDFGDVQGWQSSSWQSTLETTDSMAIDGSGYHQSVEATSSSFGYGYSTPLTQVVHQESFSSYDSTTMYIPPVDQTFLLV